MSKYYVYVLFRGNGQPFYVGMGTGSRWLVHERRALTYKSHKSATILLVLRELGEVPKIKVAEDLNRTEALAIERLFITAIGRRDLGAGSLLNATDGGEGAPNLIPEAKRRIGEAARRHHTGRSTSLETKSKISTRLAGRMFTEEHKNKLRIARQWRVVSAETRMKMKLTMRKKAADPAYRENLSRSARGLTWK